MSTFLFAFTTEVKPMNRATLIIFISLTRFTFFQQYVGFYRALDERCGYFDARKKNC